MLISYKHYKKSLPVLALAALLALAACGALGNSAYYTPGEKTADAAPPPPRVKPVKATSIENILDAEGGAWKIVEVEDEDEAISPLDQHMRARKQVNPGSNKDHEDYAMHYESDGNNTKTRTLRLEPGQGALPHKEGKYAFAELADVIIPRRKPGREIEGLPVASISVLPKHKPKYNPDARSITTYEEQNIREADQPVSSFRTANRSLEQKRRSVRKEKPSLTGNVPQIAKVRFGTHPDKIRMVLDVTDQVQYKHTLEDGNRLLVIEVPGAAWNAGLKAKIIQHPLVLGYRASSDKNGTRLSLKFKKPAQVLWNTKLPPEHGKGHRLVFDLVPLGSTS